MTRESLLITFGVLLALTPFSGLPNSWLMVLVPLLSLGVIVIGVTLRKRRSVSRDPQAPKPYEAPEA